MRAITIMYDSLNRLFLPCYGDTTTIAPNFARLAERTVTFDRFYAGSLPCIPARRELHTGRYNFLHRCWGPLEPFDDSAPSLLSRSGIYTHLVTDHAHYWQEGGSTYHTKFTSCEMIRGQEGDAWRGDVRDFSGNWDLHRQDRVNRRSMEPESEHPHVRTFQAGMDFLEQNYTQDNWYLQIEYFDPHEPYFVPQKYKDLYREGQDCAFDWPYYGEIPEEDGELVRQARANYRAVISMMDEYLGRVLDFMDAHDMWKDTVLIVNTDHGYLLGEHRFFGKNYMPNYEPIVHTPFFLWHPDVGCAGQRRGALCQTPDIAPTLLELFGVEAPETMLGRSLLPVLRSDAPIHDYILFGYFGKHVNITDGRYVYMRAGVTAGPDTLNNYTIVPLHMFEPFTVEELRRTQPQLCTEFRFTKGVPVMRVPTDGKTAPNNTCYQYEDHMRFGNLLFDLEADPQQEHPLDDSAQEQRLLSAMKELLQQNEAPAELYVRLGIE